MELVALAGRENQSRHKTHKQKNKKTYILYVLRVFPEETKS